MNDMLDVDEKELPENKLADLFRASAALRGTDGSNVPVNSDLRIHMTLSRRPFYLTELISVLQTPNVLFQYVRGGMRDELPASGEEYHFDIVSAFIKEPEDIDQHAPHRVFFDINMPFLKEFWEQRTPEWLAKYPEEITSFDALLRHPKFQACCMLSEIDKIETRNIAFDLQVVKSLAVEKKELLPQPQI